MNLFIKNKDFEDKIISLPSDVFEINFNEALVHQVVVSYLSNSHIGIKKQKSRGEVSGGGFKPWRQKGTGRARAGSTRSPLWRGGGKIFASKGILHRSRKINKKMYNLCIRIILSDLVRNNKLFVIDDFIIDCYKTKNFLEKINYLNISNNSLFVVNDFNNFLRFSTRNLSIIKIIHWKDVNPIVLMKFKSIYFTVNSIKALEGELK